MNSCIKCSYIFFEYNTYNGTKLVVHVICDLGLDPLIIGRRYSQCWVLRIRFHFLFAERSRLCELVFNFQLQNGRRCSRFMMWSSVVVGGHLHCSFREKASGLCKNAVL